MKVLWVGPETGLRYELLKKQSSLQIETTTNFDFYLTNKNGDADLALLHPDLFTQVHFPLRFEPESIRGVGFFDSFYKEHGHWVPHCLYRMAFQTALARRNSFLDFTKVCLVVGDLIEARVSMIELFRMGYRSFRILRNKGDEPHWLENQSHMLFGLNVAIVEPKELVHFSGEASVLVYGVNPKLGPIFENELSYLNFLARPGLIVDFGEVSFLAKILADTQEEALSVLSRADIESLSLAVGTSKSQP